MHTLLFYPHRREVVHKLPPALIGLGSVLMSQLLQNKMSPEEKWILSKEKSAQMIPLLHFLFALTHNPSRLAGKRLKILLSTWEAIAGK